MLLQVKERERSTERFIQIKQSALHNISIELIHDRRWNGLRADHFRRTLRVDKTVLLSLAPKKFAVKRSEQPGFHLRLIAQLMPFRGPKKKGLLRQIRSIGFLATEREGETIKWHVILFHESLEVEGGHIATLVRRGWSRQENRAIQIHPLLELCEEG